MARIIILSTCDAWKSRSSFRLYGTWGTTKAGCRRLFKKIGELIEDGTFVYEDETLSVSDQLAKFKEDEKRECTTGFIYDIQTKLKYGNLEWSELR